MAQPPPHHLRGQVKEALQISTATLRSRSEAIYMDPYTATRRVKAREQWRNCRTDKSCECSATKKPDNCPAARW